ncbi:class I SAM-dependent methyltransferase [Nanoarchaeota archaeon]
MENKISDTAYISTFELYLGLENKEQYQTEKEFIKSMDNPFLKNEVLIRDFKQVEYPRQMTYRYCTIKSEINTLNPDLLIVGACGFSPLGYTYAKQNENVDVFDTDFKDVIQYKRSKINSMPSNYHQETVDLLKNIKINLPKQYNNACFVAEGLTCYLTEQENIKLINNVKNFFKKNNIENYNLILEFYISEGPAVNKEITINTPQSVKDFLSPFHTLQKIYFENTDKIEEFLSQFDFNRISVDDETEKHSIWVCEKRK